MTQSRRIWQKPISGSPSARVRPVLISGMVLLLTALLTLIQSGQKAAASETASPAASNPADTAALNCAANPFSSGYDIFGEGEIFVGHTGGGFIGNHLSNFTLDLVPNPVEKMLLEQDLFLDEVQTIASSIQEQTTAAADLDGDGDTEMIQSFVTNNAGLPGYYIATFDRSYNVTYKKLSSITHSHLAAAGGNILGEDNEREQAVLAAVNDVTGALTIEVWDGAANGLNAIPIATWRSTTRHRFQASSVDVAVGNLNNDRKDDIVVTLLDRNGGSLEVIALTYDPAVVNGSGSNYANRLRVLATDSRSPGQLRTIQVATVRLNGDYQDEIVVAADVYQISTPGISPEIRLWTWDYNAAQRVLTRASNLNATIEVFSTNFALTTGDINGQPPEEKTVSPEEIVIGFGASGGYELGSGFAVEVWRAEDLNTPNPSVARYEQWLTNNSQRDQAEYLSLAAADLNNDGIKEIVAALDDGRGLEVLYLTHADLVANTIDVPAVNLDPTDLNGPTSVTVADRDNDVIKAVYTAECKELLEQQVTAVGFAPPHWGIIQANTVKGAAIGRTVASETLTTTALTSYRSDTVSGYLGAAVGGSYGPASVEASARVTAAQTKSRSETEGGVTGSGESLTVQRTGNEDFVIFDNSQYNCYAYTLHQNGAMLPESSLRNCDYVSTTRVGTDLNAWDNTWGAQPSSANQALTWTPVVRDWASLGLFRGAFTAQSSTFGSHSAGRAVDGTLLSNPGNSSVATTTLENNPWWQIDLGSDQPISKVRIWNRTDWLSCANLAACPNDLDHIYVMISATDFRAMAEEGNPAAMMARSDVYAFSLDDLSSDLNGISAADPLGKVTTFLTLDGGVNPQPVVGRYVRVQRVLPSSQLSLGEVQIFSTNHVNPDRYPVNIREKGTTTDGIFEAQLYNPLGTSPATTWPWVEVRGNLLWNRTGYANGVLSGESVSLGNAGINWTYSSYRSGGTFSTKELTHETRVGAEFDFSGGVVAQVQVGYGQEFTTGTTTSFTSETSWSDALEIGGKVDGFPAAYSGQWVLGCNYEMRPYYYELIETSTFGYDSRYPVLDYIVPDVAITDPMGGSSAGLNRSNSAAMANCINGNQTGGTPQANNDEGNGLAGGSTTFNVLANDIGNGLKIIGVTQPPNGTVVFDERTITYTPKPGFTGSETFSYTISDGTTSSSGTITVETRLRQLYLPAVIR